MCRRTRSLATGPGVPGKAATPGAMPIEPRLDPHEERLTEFLRKVATYLNEQAAGAAFDDLVLFAPPRALGQLRGMLDGSVTRKIRAEALKDLTKIPLEELPKHLNALG